MPHYPQYFRDRLAQQVYRTYLRGASVPDLVEAYGQTPSTIRSYLAQQAEESSKERLGLDHDVARQVHIDHVRELIATMYVKLDQLQNDEKAGNNSAYAAISANILKGVNLLAQLEGTITTNKTGIGGIEPVKVIAISDMDEARQELISRMTSMGLLKEGEVVDGKVSVEYTSDRSDQPTTS